MRMDSPTLVFLSFLWVGLNDRQHGLQALEDAFKTREPRLVGLKVEPIFDPLRADNRFTATIQTAAKVIRMVLAAPLGNRPRSGTDPGRNAWWKTRGSDITSCFTYRLTSNSSFEDLQPTKT